MNLNTSKYKIKMFPDKEDKIFLEIINTESGMIADYFSLGKIASLCPIIKKKLIMTVQNELNEAYPSNTKERYKKAIFRMRLNITYGIIIQNINNVDTLLISTLNCVSPVYYTLRFSDLTKSLRFMANAISEKAVQIRYDALLSLELEDLSKETQKNFDSVLQKYFKDDKNFKDVKSESLLREMIMIASYDNYEQGLINSEYAKRILEIANGLVERQNLAY